MGARLFEGRFRDKCNKRNYFLLMRVEDKYEQSLSAQGLMKITNVTTSLQLTL